MKPIGYEFQNKGKGLVPKNQFNVVTEHIPHRLTNVPQLTFPESLYALDESLQGYEHLYNRAGPFHVNSEMIGLNKNGNVKVWSN